MTLFWMAIALLSVLALAFVFGPWLKFRGASVVEEQVPAADIMGENIRLFREHLAELDAQLADGRLDQAQYMQLKLERERGLLEVDAELSGRGRRVSGRSGVFAFVLIALVLMVGAGAAYWKLGAGEDMQIQALQLDKQYADYQDMLANRNANPARGQAVIAAIEAKLKAEPNSVQYWFVLARTSMELGEFAKAAKAYQEVLSRDQQSGMIMAEAAQAMFLRDGNQVSPPVVDLTRGALALEPENTMALGLMGIIDFNNKAYPAAIKSWQRAVSLLGPNAGGAESLQAGIDRAKAMYLAEGGTQVQLDELLAGRKISLEVALAEGVKLAPDQLVFVYARAWQGTKMPLAITRIKVSSLPARVTLTEAMAMSPMASLANATSIELVARVSQDGSANAKPGDWQGNSGPLDIAKLPEDLKVVIDHQVSQ